MSSQAAELARRLARNAEAACRRYLSNGRRQGRYWIVGDVANTPGRSLYVRLSGPDSGPGAAGRWADPAATQYGDLLDLIRLAQGLTTLRDAMAEARRFLALPRAGPPDAAQRTANPTALTTDPAERTEAARRLFRAGRPVPGTPAEAYLRARGITATLDEPALRFHPAARYYESDGAPLQKFPALIAAITSSRGELMGIQRTFLDPHRPAKADVGAPRKALGSLLGNAVWLGLDASASPAFLAAGEGLETMLALKSVLTRLPVAAALSAGNLAALVLPQTLVRLYIAHDNDEPGLRAMTQLRARAESAGIEVRDLAPSLKDWNEDLVILGAATTHALAAAQITDVDRAWIIPRPRFERRGRKDFSRRI